jgi:hypothetical protein
MPPRTALLASPPALWDAQVIAIHRPFCEYRRWSRHILLASIAVAKYDRQGTGHGPAAVFISSPSLLGEALDQVAHNHVAHSTIGGIHERRGKRPGRQGRGRQQALKSCSSARNIDLEACETVSCTVAGGFISAPPSRCTLWAVGATAGHAAATEAVWYDDASSALVLL